MASKRLDALVRVFALLWVYIVGSIIATVVLIVGIIWMLIDVLWQFIAGSDGLSANSMPARYVKATFTWMADQTIYAVTGGGSFAWLPSP